MMYALKFTTSFKKSYKLMKKRGLDLSLLDEVIDTLQKGHLLDAKYRDHELNDNKYFKNCRELHLEPDWLLVYKINKKDLILFLMETGTHSDLFNM